MQMYKFTLFLSIDKYTSENYGEEIVRSKFKTSVS